MISATLFVLPVAEKYTTRVSALPEGEDVSVPFPPSGFFVLSPFCPEIAAFPESDVPREASEMFQCIKYEDKREVFGLKIHSFSTLDRIKKYDGSDNEENAEKPYSIEVGEIERTINLYAIASTKFQVAV